MPLTPLNEPQSVAEQYKDSTNVEARIDLHKRFSINKYGWHPWVFDHLLDLPDRCRILELGCGPGYLWQENVERIPPGWDITLSDFSSGMLEGTWRKLEKLHPFQYKVIDAQSIPYGEATFDAVIANHMLYHVPNQPAALEEIRRVLSPAGQFFTSTNGHRHMIELANLLVKFDQELAGWGAVDAPFRLKNGMSQLSAYFTDIKLYRFEDSLEVTEVTPLMDYVLSGWSAQIIGDRRDQFKEFLAEYMDARGGLFRITKEAGLFVSVPKGDAK